MEYLLTLITLAVLILIFVIIPCIIATNKTVPTDNSVSKPLTQRIVEEGVPVLSIPFSEIGTLLILFYIYTVKKEDFFTSEEVIEYICDFTKNQFKNNTFYYTYHSSRYWRVRDRVINILKRIEEENIINSQVVSFEGKNHRVYWWDENTNKISVPPANIIEEINDLTKQVANRELAIQIT